MLLDLSAAFDNVDQYKLLHVLHNEISIARTAYKWFASFLKERNQNNKGLGIEEAVKHNWLQQ